MRSILSLDLAASNEFGHGHTVQTFQFWNFR